MNVVLVVMLEDGRRAYVHNSQCGLQQGEQMLQGEPVMCDVVPDPRTAGKWQAQAVQRLNNASPTRLNAVQAITNFSQASPAPGGSGPRMQGTVAEWNERGFGFLMMEDGTRAFIHANQCGGEHLQQGELVAAEIIPDPRTPGKFQAQNVQRSGAQPWSEAPATWTPEGNGSNGALAAELQHYKQQLAVAQGRIRNLEDELQHYRAMSNSAPQAVSMVAPPQKAMILDGNVCRDFQRGLCTRGDICRFSHNAPIFNANEGQPSPAQPMEMTGPPRAIQAAGTVTEWNHAKGFGWITFEDGTFAYCHKSNCNMENLEKGEVIHANICPSPRNPGKFEAQQVTRAFGAQAPTMESGALNYGGEMSGTMGFGGDMSAHNGGFDPAAGGCGESPQAKWAKLA